MMARVEKKRIKQGREYGRIVPIGQVRKRFLGIPYWDSLIVFDSWYEAAKWVEKNPDNLNI